MRRFVSFLLVVVLVFGLCAVSVSATDNVGNEWLQDVLRGFDTSINYVGYDSYHTRLVYRLTCYDTNYRWLRVRFKITNYSYDDFKSNPAKVTVSSTATSSNFNDFLTAYETYVLDMGNNYYEYWVNLYRANITATDLFFAIVPNNSAYPSTSYVTPINCAFYSVIDLNMAEETQECFPLAFTTALYSYEASSSGSSSGSSGGTIDTSVLEQLVTNFNDDFLEKNQSILDNQEALLTSFDSYSNDVLEQLQYLVKSNDNIYSVMTTYFSWFRSMLSGINSNVDSINKSVTSLSDSFDEFLELYKSINNVTDESMNNLQGQNTQVNSHLDSIESVETQIYDGISNNQVDLTAFSSKSDANILTSLSYVSSAIGEFYSNLGTLRAVIDCSLVIGMLMLIIGRGSMALTTYSGTLKYNRGSALKKSTALTVQNNLVAKR